MPHDYFWQWHMWMFPTFMPILWFVIVGLCLCFILSRRWARKPWESGSSPEGETALDIMKKRQGGNQQRRVRADEAGYLGLTVRWAGENSCRVRTAHHDKAGWTAGAQCAPYNTAIKKDER